jgi:hypothetical protein
MPHLTEEQALSVFVLARISVKKVHKLVNMYVPDCIEYADFIRLNPWFLMETNIGLIIIGARKRVYAIDWSSTDLRRYNKE